jgi:hypothetical protein
MVRFLTLCTLLYLPIAATAQTQNILFTTDFTTATTSNNPVAYTDAPLIGQNGWAITGTSVVNALAVTNSATNGQVNMTNNGQDVNRTFTAVTSGSIFFNVAVNVSAALTGDYAIHFGDGGTSNFNARTYFKSSGTGFVLALTTSTGTPTNYGSTVLNFGTSYNLLVRYDLVSGTTNDTGALFVNPTTFDGSGDTAYITAQNIGTDATSISSFNLRQGTAANAPSLYIDSVQVFTVTPEPTMIGLVSIVVLAAARVRQRFRKARVESVAM